MSNRKLNVAVIGAGFIAGTQHIPSILKLSGRLNLTAVADNRPEALEHIRKVYGIEKT